MRLHSNPHLLVAGSPWHGQHSFPHLSFPWRSDPLERGLVLPEWKLAVRYDGDENKLNNIKCLAVTWLYQRCGLIVYQGFLEDSLGGLSPHCVMAWQSMVVASPGVPGLARTNSGAEQRAGEPTAELNSLLQDRASCASAASERSWALIQSGASDDTVSANGAEEHSVPDCLTPRLANELRDDHAGPNRKQLHDAVRKRLEQVIANYPSGLNENSGQPVSLSWEAANAFDERRVTTRKPLWMHWAAKVIPSQLIGPGIVACNFQFRSCIDHNRNGQRRLDIWFVREDGRVIVAHPGRTLQQSAKLTLHDSSDIVV